MSGEPQSIKKKPGTNHVVFGGGERRACFVFPTYDTLIQIGPAEFASLHNCSNHFSYIKDNGTSESTSRQRLTNNVSLHIMHRRNIQRRMLWQLVCSNTWVRPRSGRIPYYIGPRQSSPVVWWFRYSCFGARWSATAVFSLAQMHLCPEFNWADLNDASVPFLVPTFTFHHNRR